MSTRLGGGACGVAWSFAVLLVACGGGATPIDAATLGDAGSTADAGASDVFRARALEYGTATTTMTPVAGASFALDDASGRRQEASAGADGRVQFSISWSDGPFDLVVVEPGHVALAATGIARADYDAHLVGGDFVMSPSPDAPVPTTRTVMGAVTGYASTSNYALVQSTLGGSWQMMGSPYTLETPQGMAFRLVSCEFDAVYTGRNLAQPFYHWSISDEIAAGTSDVTSDVDLTMHAVTPHTATGSFDVPAAPAGSFFATSTPYATVVDTELTAALFGFPNAMTVSTDGRTIDYTMEWIDAPGTPHPRTRYGMSDSFGVVSSYAIEEGVPATGHRTFELLEPPSVVPSSGFPHVYDDVVLTAAPADPVSSVVYVYADDVVRYVIRPTHSVTTISIPRLPTGAPAILTGNLGRAVFFCDLTDPVDPNAYCRRIAVGGSSALDP